MARVERVVATQTFNGALEAGVRTVALLRAAFPAAYDIHRLTAYDYLLVHTEQLGGPKDLHPSGMINAPISQVRRGVVQDGLHLMMTRDLVERIVTPRGLLYRAGESAATFLDLLETKYALDMKVRANWLVCRVTKFDDSEFNNLIRLFFDAWVVEFQTAESGLAGDL